MKIVLFLLLLILPIALDAEDKHWIRHMQTIGFITPDFTLTHDGELWANHISSILEYRGRDNWDTVCKQKDVEFWGTVETPQRTLFTATNYGIWRSEDHGKSWNPSGLGYVAMRHIVIDANGTIYAGGDIAAIFYSRDNGKSWHVSDGPMENDISALALASNGDVYMGTLNGSTVLHSANKCKSWETALVVGGQISGVIGITIDQTNRVYVGGRYGLWISDENGKNFVKNERFTQAETIEVDSIGNIYVFGDSGEPPYVRLWRSSDKGKTWQHWWDSTMVALQNFITTPDGYIYAGSIGIYRSAERSIDHPVVWGTVQSCDEATFVVMDDSLSSVEFVQSSSSNVSMTVEGSFPSAKVKVTVKLIDSGKEGTYTLHAKNIQGKDLVYTAHLNTFTEKPTIERSQDTLWASGGYIFQWYKDGEKLNDEEKEYYIPKQDGKYSVTSIHVNGCMTESVPYAFTLSGVGEGDSRQETRVEQNIPNPFSQRTSIVYTLAKPGYIRLVVTDALGRTVLVLADGVQEAGEHRTELNAETLSTGVYYYRLETIAQTISRQMILIR